MTTPRPSDVAQKTFRTAMGGYSRAEVSSYLEGLAAELAGLSEERDRLASRLSQMGEQDTDFDALSHEIGQILTAAKDAADGLRARAEEEVTRWRSDAEQETTTQRTQAALDSEAMRADAWTVGTQMLQQAEVMATSLVSEAQEHREGLLAEAERDALALTGQTERDAHRLQASARREADENLRVAKMESEGMIVAARAEHDSILESANSAAEAAQERARALEVRRNEMLTELESVRATVAKVESDLQQKRESLEDAVPTDEPPVVESEVEDLSLVKIVPVDEEKTWSDSVVKLIPPTKPELTTDEIDAQGIADEVRRMKVATAEADEAKALEKDQAVRETQEREAAEAVERVAAERETPLDESDAVIGAVDEEPAIVSIDVEPPAEVDGSELPSPATEDAPVDDALDGLFASLRIDQPQPSNEPELDIESETSPTEELLPPGDRVSVPVRLEVDARELVDHLLLPITNRILRSVKRQLTDAQNLALEGIRVEEGSWEPNTGDLASDVHGDFVILAQESFAAGYSASETMTGETLGRAKPEAGDIINHSQAFADDLVGALTDSFNPQDATRDISSAASRVFRVWRTDEAERRIRHHARDAYHRGVSRGLQTAGATTMFLVVGGRGCPTCRAVDELGGVPAGSDFDGAMPPFHDGCSCTVIPGS